LGYWWRDLRWDDLLLAGGFWSSGGLLLCVLMPLTARVPREPGSGLTDDLLVFAVIVGRNVTVFFRWPDRCPPTTSRRAAEPGSGLADHRAVGMPAPP
jgi:hypothetical protein